MQELAKECKKLKVFTHVSTCYANCMRSEPIEEIIYEKDFDVESEVSKIMSMNP